MNGREMQAGWTAAEDPLSYAVEARRRDVIDMVERAVADGRAMLAFQPVVQSSPPHRVAFHEALIRIADDSGRIIPAREFIEEVEPAELGRRIDALALKLALDTLHHNPKQRIAVNMSARSVDYQPWRETLARALASEPGLGPRLVIEITERTAIEAPSRVGAFMEGLQARGVTFALDDFGSGYSSFRSIKELWFEILKIDGSYCRGVHCDPEMRALVGAMVSVGRHFEMITVAEQVENAEDVAALTALGVDCLQGYHFAAPSVRPSWLSMPVRTGRQHGA